MRAMTTTGRPVTMLDMKALLKGLVRLLLAHAIVNYAIGALICALGVITAGWFPWRLFLGSPWLIPYAVGVMAMDALGRSDWAMFAIPVWVATYAAGVALAYRWLAVEVARRQAARVARLLSNSLCPTCQYNLTGNTSGTCPECGTTIPEREGRPRVGPPA